MTPKWLVEKDGLWLGLQTLFQQNCDRETGDSLWGPFLMVLYDRPGGGQPQPCIITLWWTYKKLLNMAVEIVDFPINSMVIFHCYVSSPEGMTYYRLCLSTSVYKVTIKHIWAPAANYCACLPTFYCWFLPSCQYAKSFFLKHQQSDLNGDGSKPTISLIPYMGFPKMGDPRNHEFQY